jgi:hypothetical protein
MEGQICTVLLLSKETIQRVIKQYNGAYYITYLGQSTPVRPDRIVDGKQTYRQVERFRDAVQGRLNNMDKLTPQDVYTAYLSAQQGASIIDSSVPDDWTQLSDEQQALFIGMATRLNNAVQGEQVKRLPSRHALIKEHQGELEALQHEPTRLEDWTTRFLDKAMNAEMQRYHTVALEHLQSGGDIAQTVDALDEDEVLELFRQQGFHVCFNEDIDEG